MNTDEAEKSINKYEKKITDNFIKYMNDVNKEIELEMLEKMDKMNKYLEEVEQLRARDIVDKLKSRTYD